jgi:prephenate dehydrogenase
VHWKKVSLIGVGLLGGSLGLALKRRRLADGVVGFVRRPASVLECEALGAVDLATLDLRQAVSGADLLVFCTPLAQMRQLLKQMLPWLKPGAIVTDVGSVKGNVVKELEPLATKARGYFVGSHPMAGSEKTGVTAARAELFSNAICVVTPTRKTNPRAMRAISRLWRDVGAKTIELSPEAHDDLVSRSSHLPHVVAATLANFVLDPSHPKQQGTLCANGFRDTTRVASGSPEMWRDIALSNRDNLGKALGSYIHHLELLRGALRRSDVAAVSRLFETARLRRNRWAAKAHSLASPE